MLRARESLMMGEINVPGSVVVPDVGVDKLVLIRAFRLSRPYSAPVTIDIVGSKRRASNPSLILGAT
jgi:hypothetical protein